MDFLKLIREEEYQTVVRQLAHEDGIEVVLSIPGVWELVAEFYNNAAIELWQKELPFTWEEDGHEVVLELLETGTKVVLRQSDRPWSSPGFSRLEYEVYQTGFTPIFENDDFAVPTGAGLTLRSTLSLLRHLTDPHKLGREFDLNQLDWLETYGGEIGGFAADWRQRLDI